MSTLARFPGSTGSNPFFKRDNTFRSLTGDFQTPAYAASIALVLSAAKTIVQPALLTGNVTFTANVGNGIADAVGPFAGDVIEFQFTADTTARVVTFGTGFTPNGTLTVAISSTAIIEFKFNGISWLQTEVGNARNVDDIQTPAYAATLSVTTTKKVTKVIPAQLTGAATINAVVTGAVAGDILILSFSADGTNRVVTFGTNFTSAGTLTVVASKFGSASFIFNGTAFTETGRALTA